MIICAQWICSRTTNLLHVPAFPQVNFLLYNLFHSRLNFPYFFLFIRKSLRLRALFFAPTRLCPSYYFTCMVFFATTGLSTTLHWARERADVTQYNVLLAITDGKA